MGLILRRHLNKETENYDFHARSFKSLNGFEFNMKSQLKELLWTLPETRILNGKLRVTLPEIDIKNDLHFPDNANSCTVFLSVHYGSLKTEDERIGTDETNPIMEISRDHSHTTKQEWTYDIPEGCYAITSIALHYHDKWERYQLSVNSPEMSPAMICDISVNPGTFSVKPDRTWTWKNFYFEDVEPKSSETAEQGGTQSEFLDSDEQSAEETAALQAACQPCCISAPITYENPFIDIGSAQITVQQVSPSAVETKQQYEISNLQKQIRICLSQHKRLL